MTKINTGGPAFPVVYGNTVAALGLMERDYIAIHASEEDIKKHQTQVSVDIVNHYSREEARYRYADAMLAAREATKGGENVC